MASGLRFEFRQRQYLFRFRLNFFLLCLLFFVLLCQLGVWQLHRYHFKKELLTHYTDRVQATPQDFSTVIKTADLQFQHVVVKGKYLPAKSMLIQNRMHNDEAGYEVITPFQVQGQPALLLINRGWVKSPPTVEQVTAQSATEVTGVIKLLNEYQFILGKNILHPDASPLVMQKIDTTEIEKILHAPVYPFILRLDATAPAGYVRQWTAVNVSPERHRGYAVQWFVMATVLLLAYFSFSIERVMV